ncbi:unnamed protein product [Triticum turgidum subsp. durum]|uniref:ENTH domain-containing protein n=1 Tax=Triticum turgidum subsp. durum TaxID=4567 RepID=A0A9R0VLD8_TRITD|nr:unnamed protein product [Triticum turgidum subsp. durum]
MADIARATKNMMFVPLAQALAVAEYLLANGTERAAEEIIDNSSQIAKLTTFEFVEPGGKDVGLNVRKKAEAVLVIVDDREKLQQAREKAASTRDKYLGVSSTGMSSYKSSAASFGSGTYSSGSRYGSTAGSRETASFKDRHTGTELSKNNNKPRYSSTRQRSKETTTKSANSSKLAKGGSKSMSNPRATPAVPSSQKGKNEDDGDEFNPRGSSTSGHYFFLTISKVWLDCMITTVSLSLYPLLYTLFNMISSQLHWRQQRQVVLTLRLAILHTFQLIICIQMPLQGNIDLFAGRPSFGGSATADMEFSVRGAPNKHIEQKTSSPVQPSASAFDPFNPSFAAIFPSDTEFSVRGTPSKSSQGKLSSDTAFDPLAGIPVKRFNGSNSSGVWSSSKGSAVTEPTHGSPGASKSSDCSPSEELNFGAFASHEGSRTASVTKSMNESLAKQKQDSMAASKPAVKKGTFRGKSSIWADSLSRGLIDLNLAAPKMVDPSDARVVRRLSNGSEEKAPETVPWYMEAATGTPEFPRSTGAGGESRIF